MPNELGNIPPKEEEVQANTPPVESVDTPPIQDDGIKKYFPNVEVTDANRAELENAVSQLESIPKLQTTAEKVNEIVDEHPDFAGVLLDLSNGASFREALARNVDDIDSLSPMEDEPDFEAWGKARDERKGKNEERKKRDETRKGNEEKSIEVLKAFIQEKRMDDEAALNFVNAVDALLNAAFDGDLTKDLLEHVFNTMNRDADLANSYEDGKIDARNEKIAKSHIDELENKEKGSGLPDLSGGSNAPKKKKSFGAKFMEDVFN